MKPHIFGSYSRILFILVSILALNTKGLATDSVPSEPEEAAWRKLKALESEFHEQKPAGVEQRDIDLFLESYTEQAGGLADQFKDFLHAFPESAHANEAWGSWMDLLGVAAHGSTNRMSELEAAELAILNNPEASPSRREAVRNNQIDRTTDLLERERLVREFKDEVSQPNDFFCFHMLLVARHREFPRSLEIVQEILQLTEPPTPKVAQEIRDLKEEQTTLLRQAVKDEQWLESYRAVGRRLKALDSAWHVQSKHHRDEALELKATLDRIGKQVDLTFTALDGTAFALEDYRGKVVLLNFWATWCPPCVGKIPEVNEVLKAHHDAGFEVIGISYDTEREVLERFLDRHELPWAHHFQPEGNEAPQVQSIGSPGPPAYWLLDQRGVLVDITAGHELEAKVLRLLNSATEPVN